MPAELELPDEESDAVGLGADPEAGAAPLDGGGAPPEATDALAGMLPALDGGAGSARVRAVLAEGAARALNRTPDDSITRVLKRAAAGDPTIDFLSAISMSSKMPLGEAFNRIRAGQITAAEKLGVLQRAQAQAEATQAYREQAQTQRANALAAQTARASAQYEQRRQAAITGAMNGALTKLHLDPSANGPVMERAAAKLAELGPKADALAAYGAVIASAKELNAPSKPEAQILAEKKTQMIRGAFPQLSEQEASALALGTVRLSVDPTTGERYIVDLASGRERKPTAGAGAPGLPKKTSIELRDQNVQIENILNALPKAEASLDKAVGVVSNLRDLEARTLGQIPGAALNVPGVGKVGVGEAAVSSDVVTARQQLRQLRELVVNFMRTRANTPLEQQKRILALVADPDKLMESGPNARIKLNELRAWLNEQRAQNTRSLGGEGGASGLPADVPEGSKRVGTSTRGNPVYQAPDGRKLEVTP